MTYAEILTFFDNVTECGNGHTALCPAHYDNRNSLSLAEGDDGKILIYCHAGCYTQDIVAAAGLEMKDLFPAPGF